MFISAIISAITSGIVSLAVFKFKEHSKAKENNRITGQAIVNYAIINLSFDLKRLNQAINSNCDNELVYFPLVKSSIVLTLTDVSTVFKYYPTLVQYLYNQILFKEELLAAAKANNGYLHINDLKRFAKVTEAALKFFQSLTPEQLKTIPAQGLVTPVHKQNHSTNS